MKTMRLVWNILMIVVIVMVLTIAALLYGAPIVGMRAFVITGNSMEPTYKENSVAYVTEKESYEKGDVILFTFDQSEAEHVAISRVYEVNDDGTYVTKTDTREEVDDGVRKSYSIVGVVRFSLPYIGAIPGLLKSINAIYIVLGVALLLISATIIINVIYNESFKEMEEITNMIEEVHVENDEIPEPENHDNVTETSEQEEKLDAPAEEVPKIEEEKIQEQVEETPAYVPIGFAPVEPNKIEASTEEVDKKEEVYRPLGNDDEASVYEVIYRR